MSRTADCFDKKEYIHKMEAAYKSMEVAYKSAHEKDPEIPPSDIYVVDSIADRDGEMQIDTLALPDSYNGSLGNISIVTIEPGRHKWDRREAYWETFFMLKGVMFVNRDGYMPAMLKAGAVDMNMLEIVPGIGREISTIEGAVFYSILTPARRNYG
jgi:hypothetical protein